MQQYSEVVQDANGKAQTGVEVSVLLNGQLATIYAADGITPADNPLTTDAHGGFTFKAADGTYTLTALGTSKSVTLFDPGVSGAAASVGFVHTGAGAVARSVQDKLRDMKTAADYATLSQYLVADGLDWVENPASGVFSYLVQSAGARAQSAAGGFGYMGVARTSTTAGGSSDAALGIGGFAYNDKGSGSLAGAWALYGTAVRASGVLGPTQALELDIANWGASVPLYPGAMFPNGGTRAAWLGSGGESTATPGLVGTASCALGILSNDPAGIANFDKGIVFHNKAIAGADGTGPMGCAIAFATGHQQIWFNNANQAVGEVVCTNTVLADAIRLDFSQFGAIFEDRASGSPLVQVSNVANPANYLTFTAAASGAHPKVTVANSAGANVNLQYETKGTGVHDFRNVSVVGTAGTQYGFAVMSINGTSFKIPVYNV